MTNAPTVEELAPAEVAALMRDRRILLVDVREPDEYANQRIPGAVLYPLSTFDPAALPSDEPRPVVFHCAGGKRSEMAARARLGAGAPRARHLAGGIAAWAQAGLPVIRLDPSTGKPVLP